MTRHRTKSPMKRPAALPSAEGVAQVSKPAVSRVSKPANRSQYQARRRIPRPADLEVGDTAGLETCATYEADPGARTLSMHFLLPPSQMTALLPSAEGVAQVSKPAVSRVSKPANRCQYQARLGIPRPADLEVGDTAGLETCATYEAGPGARTLSMHFLLRSSLITDTPSLRHSDTPSTPKSKPASNGKSAWNFEGVTLSLARERPLSPRKKG